MIDNIGMSSLGLIAQGIQWVGREPREVRNRRDEPLDRRSGRLRRRDRVASQAVDAAVAAGIVVVIAAGNSGPANCTVKSPGAVESALTVGAMADTGAGGFSQAFFSSRGPTADGRIKPDISAAGRQRVRWPSPAAATSTSSGTSVATPFMTGTALLMLQVNPALTPAAGQADDR